MENGWSWEQKTFIDELIQGMELTKQLGTQLGSTTSSADTREFLVQQILSSFEKALSMLKGSKPTGQTQTLGATTSVVPESPISINGSPLSEDFDGTSKDIHRDSKNSSKKRKVMPRCTSQVKFITETGLEGSHDDGYSWRKYGQKDILAAKYPRSYYRCTYRNTQNCGATKQVQRSDEDPTVFEVTYRGAHTCSLRNQSVSIPASPEKQEKKPNNHDSNHRDEKKQLQSMLISFREALRVETEGLDNKDMAPPPFSFPSTSFEHGHRFSPQIVENNTMPNSFSPSFVDPATPETNYYSVTPWQMNNHESIYNVQYSESDFQGLVSAHTSTSSSPIFDMDFSLDSVEIDPNFPFDSPEFFC